MPQIVRKHATVTGKVQGVGFRAYTQYNASKLGVIGWVRNVGYDQVEVEAQAVIEVLEQFFTAVKNGPSSSRVDELNIKDLEVSTEDRGFQIRHSR